MWMHSACRPTVHDGTTTQAYCVGFAAQRSCTVYGTCEESWSAMAEWVMFDVVVSHDGGLSHAIFFRFDHLMLVLAHGYSFETLAWSRNVFPGRPTWGERKANFFLHFLRRSTSAGQISSRHWLRSLTKIASNFKETLTHPISFTFSQTQLTCSLRVCPNHYHSQEVCISLAE